MINYSYKNFLFVILIELMFSGLAMGQCAGSTITRKLMNVQNNNFIKNKNNVYYSNSRNGNWYKEETGNHGEFKICKNQIQGSNNFYIKYLGAVSGPFPTRGMANSVVRIRIGSLRVDSNKIKANNFQTKLRSLSLDSLKSNLGRYKNYLTESESFYKFIQEQVDSFSIKQRDSLISALDMRRDSLNDYKGLFDTLRITIEQRKNSLEEEYNGLTQMAKNLINQDWRNYKSQLDSLTLELSNKPESVFLLEIDKLIAILKSKPWFDNIYNFIKNYLFSIIIITILLIVIHYLNRKLQKARRKIADISIYESQRVSNVHPNNSQALFFTTKGLGNGDDNKIVSILKINERLKYETTRISLLETIKEYDPKCILIDRKCFPLPLSQSVQKVIRDKNIEVIYVIDSDVEKKSYPELAEKQCISRDQDAETIDSYIDHCLDKRKIS